MHYGGWYPFAGGGLVGLLVFAVFVVLIVWGIAWIIRRDSPRYGAPPPTPSVPQPPRADTAVQILRERFARGEIGEAEYRSASHVLGAPEPPAGGGPDRPPGSPPA